MIGNMFASIFGFFLNLFSVLLGSLTTLFGFLFNGLISVLKAIFKPILILVALVFYFVYKLAEFFLVLLQVLLAIGKLLYSFVMGLFRTLAGFVWTPAPPDHGSWSGAISEVFTALEPYQLDKIAYVILFIIWILTAMGAIRILSSRGQA